MTTLIETPDTGDPLGRRDRAILELFYASGLRLSELVGIDLEDVNLPGRMLRVMGKGGKERMLPFNHSAETAMRAWMKDREVILLERRRQKAEGRRQEGRRHKANANSEPRSAVPQLPWHAPDRPQRAPDAAAIHGALQYADGHQPARAAPLVCDAPAAARRRSARDPGVVGARAPEHDAALHARQRRAAHRRVSQIAPASGSQEWIDRLIHAGTASRRDSNHARLRPRAGRISPRDSG